MYKLICNDVIVDVLKEVKYIRYLSKYNKFVLTDKSSAHGVYGSDNKTIYIFEGKLDCPQNNHWKIVKMQKINDDEYLNLYDKLLNKILVQSNLAKLYVERQEKIKEMSAACNETIISGVSVRLSDGYYHNFRLTVEDQLNLLSIDSEIRSGVQSFIYHETNKTCKIFTADDMKKVIETATKFRNSHTTYFNILKHCINSMNNTNEIQSVYYGIDISELNPSSEIQTLLKEVQYVK